MRCKSATWPQFLLLFRFVIAHLLHRRGLFGRSGVLGCGTGTGCRESDRAFSQLPRQSAQQHPCKRTGTGQAVYGFRGALTARQDALLGNMQGPEPAHPAPARHLGLVSSSCHTTVLWLQQKSGTSSQLRRRHFQTANQNPRPACNCRPDLRRLLLYPDYSIPTDPSRDPCSASLKKQLRGTSVRRNSGSA